MILDISDEEFKRVFSNKQLHLPIRWNNYNFVDTLETLFNIYKNEVRKCRYSSVPYIPILVDLNKIDQTCELLITTVKHYLNGFPSKAFTSLKKLMTILQEKPLQTYHKSVLEQLQISDSRDPLHLYRVTCVNENTPYGRDRVFHTPYRMRSKISTSRYSIAGFPSLYLGTSLELCCEEVHYNPHEQFALASQFQLVRYYEYNNIFIKVIELAIKPQDFLNKKESDNFQNRNMRLFPRGRLSDTDLRSAYLLWYPLIAACSFIRVNKKDPFAAEYIIPQLLMQWVRSQIGSTKNSNTLIGIRYFSCASEKASDMGFNYVFPASGAQTKASFCPILTKAFMLTKPYYIHEYYNFWDCESALNNDNNLQFVEE